MEVTSSRRRRSRRGRRLPHYFDTTSRTPPTGRKCLVACSSSGQWSRPTASLGGQVEPSSLLSTRRRDEPSSRARCAMPPRRQGDGRSRVAGGIFPRRLSPMSARADHFIFSGRALRRPRRSTPSCANHQTSHRRPLQDGHFPGDAAPKQSRSADVVAGPSALALSKPAVPVSSRPSEGVVLLESPRAALTDNHGRAPLASSLGDGDAIISTASGRRLPPADFADDKTRRGVRKQVEMEKDSIGRLRGFRA